MFCWAFVKLKLIFFQKKKVRCFLYQKMFIQKFSSEKVKINFY